MAYEFGGCLYRNSREFHDAIASEYMSAGGLNGPDFIRNELNTSSPESIVSDMLRPEEWGNLTENEDFDRDEMIAAIKRLKDQY